MKLHDLRPTPGSRTEGRRIGRGHGSGRGKTAGRGTKGQKSRAGGNLPSWFEGGQTPIHVRTPKLHGFKNRFRVEYVPLNLARLSDVTSGTLVTPDVLAHDGVIDDTRRPVKILGVGEAPKGITIHAHAFSRSALDKLAAAGSTVQRLGWPDNAPIDEAEGTDAPASDEAADAAPAAATEAGAETGADEATEADEGNEDGESEPQA
jgi:large subunit ribosomal protein L15